MTVTAAATDGNSGIASYQFTALGAGWTSTPGALGVNTYSYSAPNPTVPSGGQDVKAFNHAGQQSAGAAFAVIADATAPTGGNVTYTGGTYTTASVGVTFSPGSDAGSGLDAASGLLQRQAAPLSAGVCGTYGGFATIASNPSTPYTDTSRSSGQCYRYRYLVSDAVGNQAPYTSASVVKLDTQGPSHAFSLLSPAAASLSGTTLYYKGNGTGSFRLVDTLTDVASGVLSAAFPTIATAGWTHATETLNTPTGGPFQSTAFTWTASPTNPAGYAVTGVDNAGNSNATGITFASDITAPTGGSVSHPEDVLNTLSVPITLTNGSDGQSGINVASVTLKRDQATLTTLTETCGAFANTYATTVTLVGGADTGVATARCYRYRYLVSDNVGNQASFDSTEVTKVDTSGPRVTAIASQQSAGGAGDGLLAVGDKLILTFNQALASLPATFTGGTETRAGSALGTPNVMLEIPGITLGARNTGTDGYFVGCLALCAERTATFNGSIVLLNNGTSTTVTLTVTSVSGDTRYASSGNLSFAPAATITDRGGNSATGTQTFSSVELF